MKYIYIYTHMDDIYIYMIWIQASTKEGLSQQHNWDSTNRNDGAKLDM